MSTELDSAQILPLIYDPVENAIQVEVVSGGGGTEVNIAGVTPVYGALPVDVIAGGNIITKPYDSIALTYIVSGNGVGQVGTVQYYLGGLSGTLVNTLTLSYNSSNNVISVVRT